MKVKGELLLNNYIDDQDLGVLRWFWLFFFIIERKKRKKIIIMMVVDGDAYVRNKIKKQKNDLDFVVILIFDL